MMLLTLGMNIGATDDDKKVQEDQEDSTKSEQIISSADSTLNKIDNISTRLDSVLLVLEQLNKKK